MSYHSQTRTEYLIGPKGGPAKTVQITHRVKRVVTHSEPQVLFTDPKSKKQKLLSKKEHTVTIK